MMAHNERQDGAGVPQREFTLPRALRLRRGSQFKAVMDARVLERAGPLLLRALPNDLPHPRLGLAISRRVGSAVRRNRLKRLLREAFRLGRHDLPPGYDYVISAVPHEILPVQEYQRLLGKAGESLHRKWTKR